MKNLSGINTTMGNRMPRLSHLYILILWSCYLFQLHAFSVVTTTTTTTTTTTRHDSQCTCSYGSTLARPSTTRLFATATARRLPKSHHSNATDVEAVEVPFPTDTSTTTTTLSFALENSVNNNNNKKKSSKKKDNPTQQADANLDTSDSEADAITINEEDEDTVEVDPLVRQRHARWVVLIDDEEAIRTSIGQFLFDAGYQVTACADAEAFSHVCSLDWKFDTSTATTTTTSTNTNNNDDTTMTWPRLPDVIICDIRMPGTVMENGLHIVQRLRDDVRWQRVPIVLLTAKALTPDRIAGYQAGANVYLTKPFAPAELLSIVDNCWQRQEQMMRPGEADLWNVQSDVRTIKALMMTNAQQTRPHTRVYLTPTERQVLVLLSQGLTNAEIAHERQVHVKNVIKTISKMNAATNTRNRTELVRWGLQTGYIPR
jgi:DNA-binding NarL/FixJ family response regulator